MDLMLYTIIMGGKDASRKFVVLLSAENQKRGPC